MRNLTKFENLILEQAEGYLITLNKIKKFDEYKACLILLQTMFETSTNWHEIHSYLITKYSDLNNF